MITKLQTFIFKEEDVMSRSVMILAVAKEKTSK